MITPAYAPTATERVLPRLALDFTTGVLDPRVTVTRALNTATRVNSSGLIETVNANLPRFDYDPATLAPKGLLIEETRANLLLHSSGANESAWTKDATGTGVAPVVTPNFAVAPDGTTTADRIEFNRGAGTTVSDLSRVFQFIGGTDTRTATVYLKSNDANTYSLQLLTGSNVQNISVTPSSFTRFSVSGASGANFMLRLAGSVGASTTADILFWGAQLEAGAFATSYIPTTTTSLTRNSDVVSMTGTNFSSWYNASEGAFLAEYSSNAATASTFSKAVISVNDTTLNNRLYVNISTSAIPFVFINSSGSSQANISTGVTLTNETTTKTAFAYKADSFVAATNGAAVGTDSLGLVPAVSALNIGHQVGFASLFGHMKKLSYWPQRLINSETQSFSK
jgi:hypothetical protein